MTEKSKALDPTDVEDVTGFDLEAWLDDAKLPQRSMVVYRRADLRSELDEIERKIRMSDGDAEGGSNEVGSNALRAQWEKVAEQIADSAITVTVRALTDDVGNQARADAKAQGVKETAAADWDEQRFEDEVVEAANDEADIDDLDDEDRESLVRRRKVEQRRAYINARYATAVAEHALTRLLVKPRMTVEQVRHLSEQIGSAARDELMSLPNKASGDMRPVSAPFSRPSSPGRRGGTSSKRSGQQKDGRSRR